MNRFAYLRDRLFLLGVFSYAFNRWAVKPIVHRGFCHDHLADLLLIPCALPPLLLVQRWMGLRQHDRPPEPAETILHLVVWSVLFEWIGPHLMRGKTGDPLDVAAYATGALLSLAWWNRRALGSKWNVRHEF